MKRPSSVPRLPRALPLLLLGTLLLGCADPAATVRRHTYPHDFRYISRDEIRSAMWELAALIGRLETLTDDPGQLEANRLKIAHVLQQIEDTTNQIKHEGESTNHPLIHANLDGYREHVKSARVDVEREPPDYFRATTLPDACMDCHSP